MKLPHLEPAEWAVIVALLLSVALVVHAWADGRVEVIDGPIRP